MVAGTTYGGLNARDQGLGRSKGSSHVYTFPNIYGRVHRRNSRGRRVPA